MNSILANTTSAVSANIYYFHSNVNLLEISSWSDATLEYISEALMNRIIVNGGLVKYLIIMSTSYW